MSNRVINNQVTKTYPKYLIFDISNILELTFRLFSLVIIILLISCIAAYPEILNLSLIYWAVNIKCSSLRIAYILDFVQD